jgi:hypothetical protein
MILEGYQGHFEELGGYTSASRPTRPTPTLAPYFVGLPEDPFLAGELVADETLGVQSEGLIVTLKHMAMNDFENARTNTAIKLDERMLHELAGHALLSVSSSETMPGTPPAEIGVQPHLPGQTATTKLVRRSERAQSWKGSR